MAPGAFRAQDPAQSILRLGEFALSWRFQDRVKLRPGEFQLGLDFGFAVLPFPHSKEAPDEDELYEKRHVRSKPRSPWGGAKQYLFCALWSASAIYGAGMGTCCATCAAPAAAGGMGT